MSLISKGWLENSFLNPELCDLKLAFSSCDKKVVHYLPAQSFVLRASFSPVLRRMVDDEELVASKPDDTGFKVLQFSGVEMEVSMHFLHYIYTEDIGPLSEMELLYLIKAADMYDMGGLLQLCEERILSKINLDNAAFIYEFLELIPSPKNTKKKCLTLLGENATHVFKINSHFGLNEENLIKFLETTVLHVPNEYLVLKALLEWAKRKCFMSFLPFTKDALLNAFKVVSKHVNWREIDLSARYFPETEILENLKKTKALWISDLSSLRAYTRVSYTFSFTWPTC